MAIRIAGLALVAALSTPVAAAQEHGAVRLSGEYGVWSNIVYRTASGAELKLDVIRPERLDKPNPVLVYFHGGGWVEGSKDEAAFNWMPYAARGFSVVNVGYRLGRVALAPAAVEDARCALRWIVRNAAEHKFDLDRIVTAGHSAGGHLALTTGFLIPADGFDATCPTEPETRWSSGAEPAMKVAAVVNWFGITDVADLLTGPNAKHYAIEWLGALPSRAELARAVSPLSLVRPTSPPVVSVHGDADPLVPHSHAVRLHAALDKAGVRNRLHTIAKGDHGGFSVAEQRAAFDAIFAFLGERGLLPEGR